MKHGYVGGVSIRRATTRVETAPASIEELKLGDLDDSTAELIAEAEKTIEDLERGELKREEVRELDQFAERIADSVAARLVDHGL